MNLTGMRWAGGWTPDPENPGREQHTWTDACQTCGATAYGIDVETITIRSNPEAVLGIKDPHCLYNPDDPDSPDCTCTVIINPAPDPLPDRIHITGYTWTLQPCGHQGTGTFKIYKQTRTRPGTLGALMEKWNATQ